LQPCKAGIQGMQTNSGAAQMAAAESAGELPQLWAGAWDPHDANRFVTAGGNHLQARLQSGAERDAPWPGPACTVP